jgi:hypothetical protein
MIYRAMLRTTSKENQLVELARLVRTTDPVQVQMLVLGWFSVAGRSHGWLSVPPRLMPGARGVTNIPTDEIAAGKSAEEDQRLFDREVAEFNRTTEQSAQPVYALLKKSTSQELNREPNAWWEWWRKYNGRTLTDKPYNRRAGAQVDNAQLVLSSSRYVGAVQISCLVAGTQVQTDTGLNAIESIQVGDMVLSQDVETGELALKPVVSTTLRDPETIYRIKTESGDIRATGGHRWWVAGRGWIMSKQLEADMLLHNAKGTTKILAIETEADPLPTHNLVVDGFHTYFVGADRVLSFDNVDPIPTLCKVPGYK